MADGRKLAGMLRWMGSARHLVVLVSVLVVNLTSGIHRVTMRAADELTITSSSPAQELVLITSESVAKNSVTPKWTTRYLTAIFTRAESSQESVIIAVQTYCSDHLLDVMKRPAEPDLGRDAPSSGMEPSWST